MADDSGRTLDQVILEYLTSEAEQEQLVLSMEQDIELAAGSSAVAELRTVSSRSGQAVAEYGPGGRSFTHRPLPLD